MWSENEVFDAKSDARCRAGLGSVLIEHMKSETVSFGFFAPVLDASMAHVERSLWFMFRHRSD